MMTWPPTKGIKTVQSDHKPISFKGGDAKPKPLFLSYYSNAINKLKCYGVIVMRNLCPVFS